MKKPIALLVVLLVLFAQPLAVFAAGNESLHENYITDAFNEANGLPTGEANTLVQTRDGYLWIGSYGGLIRHDGSTFVDFSGNLASSAIRALFEASDGTLYIGTNDAGAYAFKDDVFTPLRAEDEHLFLCIRDFAEGPDGTIYVASPSGVAKIVENTLVAYTYRAFSGEQFLNVAVDRFGNVWAMASSGMTYILDDDQLYDVCSSDEFFEDSLIYTVAADADGTKATAATQGTISSAAFVFFVPSVPSVALPPASLTSTANFAFTGMPSSFRASAFTQIVASPFSKSKSFAVTYVPTVLRLL